MLPKIVTTRKTTAKVTTPAEMGRKNVLSTQIEEERQPNAKGTNKGNLPNLATTRKSLAKITTTSEISRENVQSKNSETL